MRFNINNQNRNSIGYTYPTQVISNIGIVQKTRNPSLISDENKIFHHQTVVPENETVQDASSIKFLPTTSQETEGDGLKLAGQGLNLPGQQKRNCCPKAGSGLNPAGSGLILSGTGTVNIRKPTDEKMLPGDTLRKKLLSKMVKEKKMVSLGDRKKSKPIRGGSINIDDTSSGQSRSKDLGSKSYKLDPKSIVGQGMGEDELIKEISEKAVHILKKEKLIPQNLSKDVLMKLITIRAKKIMSTVKEPLEVIKRVLSSMKNLYKTPGSGMKGSGISETLNKITAKILAAIFRSGNKDSVFGNTFDHLGKGKKGGFIFSSIAAIIAAISAAASTAGAVAIGGTTVGALATGALTAGATAAGATAGAGIVNKIAGKGIGSVTHQIKPKLVKIVKDQKITTKDLTKQEKNVIQEGIKKLRENPSTDKVISFARQVAPIALKITQKKLKPKVKKIVKKEMGGSGIQGKVLEKKFKNYFVKELVKKI